MFHKMPERGINTLVNPKNSSITLPGWVLAIAVSADIPLVDAAEKGVNKREFMEGTSLSVTPPAEMEEAMALILASPQT